MIRSLIKHICLPALMLMLAALLALHRYGLPDPMVRRLERRLQLPGMAVLVERVKFGLFEGIIATDVRFYLKGDIGEPVLTARSIVIHPRLFHDFSWAPGPRRILIRGGAARLPPGFIKSEATAALRLQAVEGALAFDPPRTVRVEHITGQALGIRFAGRGNIFVPPASHMERPTATLDYDPSHIAALDSLLRYYLAMHFPRQPGVETEFELHLADPARNYCDFRVEIQQVHADNWDIAGLRAGARLQDGRLHGALHIRRAEIMDLPLHDFQTAFTAETDNINLDDLKVTVGPPGTGGPLRMHAHYNFTHDRFQGRVRTDFTPDVLLPMLDAAGLDAGVANVKDFDFTAGPPPQINADMHGTLAAAPRLWLTGTAQAGAMAYETVDMQTARAEFTAGFSATNAFLTLDPLTAVRPEGSAQGRLHLDFINQFVEFDASSTADPQSVARAIHMVLAEIVEPFSFEGPARVRAAGRVGFKGQDHDAVQLLLEGRKAGWKFLMADYCNLNIEVAGESIMLSDIEGGIFGGQFESTTRFHQDSAGNYHYELAGQADGIEFQKLMRAIDAQDPDRYRGRMTLDLQLTGPANTNALQATVGAGRVRIANGRIFQIPLFGGLSDILSRILPGIGLVMRQTDLRADFTVSDGKVASDDIRIEGDVLSLRAAGAYHLDDRLDFKVQITFLRRHTLIGSIMRLATFPVSKILEFQLSGTMDNPRWRMTYIPRDLLPFLGEKPEKPEPDYLYQ